MMKLDRVQNITRKIDSLEQRFDSFRESIIKYKQLQYRASGDTQGKKDETSRNAAKGPDTSLFEGLLQQVLHDIHYQVDGADENEATLGIILENTPDSVAEMDRDGRIFKANPAFMRLFGYDNNELKGKSVFTILPVTYHSVFRERIDSLDAILADATRGREELAYSTRDIFVLQAIKQDGSIVSLECLLSFYRRSGTKTYLLILRDVSCNRHLVEQLKEIKDHYDALSETITETILRIDDNFTIVFTNSAIRTTFGYDREEILGNHFSFLFPKEIFERHEKDFRKYFFIDDQHRKELGIKKTLEILGKNKNRGVSPMEMSFGNSKDYKGRTLTCIIRDITQRKNIERKLRHLAFHDQLTNLGNRDLFNLEIRGTFEINRKLSKDLSALMFLDLDGFKHVNDTLGHDTGDELLIETAKRLRAGLRESDSVYRFGGDEFVVLLPSIHKRKDAAKVAVKILGSLRSPFRLAATKTNSAVHVGVSIGIAIIPADGNDVETITKNADLAMYSAKENGKNRYVFYGREMDKKSFEKWEIEQGIKQGIQNKEFRLCYQPLVNLDGRIMGMEALIRWTHPELGPLSPGAFIPIAEESGLIIPLGNWILEQACRDTAKLNEEGHPDLFISINLSSRQFEQKDLVETIGSIIQRTKIKPTNLKLEITESSIMNAPEEAIKKMEDLKTKNPGIRLAIDDFGTGYSSLSYLSKLPADQIKIDLSFVSKLFSMNNEKIVNAIINLAHSLSMEIVAEGVESHDQFIYFKQKKCGFLQGFHFYKPLEPEELLSALSKPLGVAQKKP